MPKLMIVTVGTSLFTSASWNEDNEDFIAKLENRLAKEYKTKWANPGGGLYAPEQRKREGKILEPFFKQELKADNAATWADWVVPYNPKQNRFNMRYSAEIATILGFGKNQKGEKWKSFLEEYDIYFVHDTNEASQSYIAAKHNCEYLKTMLNCKIDVKDIPNLSSDYPANLVKGLEQLQTLLIQAAAAKENYQTIDIIISGGYKIYGLIGFGFLTSPRYGIIYQHEDSDHVVILRKGSIRIGSTPEVSITLIH